MIDISISSSSLGGAVFISTLYFFCIAVIVLPFFPTTCFPMPGGITTIWVFMISISGLVDVDARWCVCCGVCGLDGGWFVVVLMVLLFVCG